MSITISNIIVGEGRLFLSTSTSDTTLVDVGATQQGVEWSWEPSMVDIEVDQLGDAARVIQEKVRVMIKTNLAEATLANLAYAWGYKTGLTAADTAILASQPGVSGTVFNVGVHSTYPAERLLQVQGVAPGSNATTTKIRYATARRVISYSTSSSKMARSENVSVPVEFRLLPDPAYTGSEYLVISDTA